MVVKVEVIHGDCLQVVHKDEFMPKVTSLEVSDSLRQEKGTLF